MKKAAPGTRRRRGTLSGLDAGVGSVLVPQPSCNSWAGGSEHPSTNGDPQEPTAYELLERRKAAIPPGLFTDAVIELLQGFEMLAFPLGEEIVEVPNLAFIGALGGACEVLDGP